MLHKRKLILKALETEINIDCSIIEKKNMIHRGTDQYPEALYLF